MSNGLFDDIDLTTVISDETIRQRFVVSSEQITGEEAEVSDPPGDADRVFNATQDEGFDSIQDAIDEANDGDTIQLNDDTFEEDLTIGVPNITIEALVDVTIISVVSIEASGVRIEGCEFNAPDRDVDRIVFVTDDAEEVELNDCSFSGVADVALIFEGDNGEVIDCDFEEVDVDDEEHVFIVRGNDVLIRACVFLVVTEVEAVLVEANNVDIEDCEFEAVNIIVTRFIVVIEGTENVSIVGCTFEGEVQFEVIVLDGTNSTIRNCNFEDVVKTDTETSIILVTGDGSVVEECIFLVTDVDGLEAVVLVEEANDVEITDCDFEADDVTVQRFIIIKASATDVVINKCEFHGTVVITVIEHDGTGESKISDCELEGIDLDDDDATLIIRVDEVTVEDIDVTFFTVEIVDFETDSVGIIDEGDPIILPTITAGQGFEITFDVQIENVGESGEQEIEFSDETDRDNVGPSPIGLSPGGETVDLAGSGSDGSTELLEFSVETFTAQDYEDGDEFRVEINSDDDSVARGIKIEEEEDDGGGIPVDPVL